jgi:hypothetical protein
MTEIMKPGMLMSRHQNAGQHHNIKTAKSSFENVGNSNKSEVYSREI